MIVKESKKMKEALHDDELSDLIDELQTVLDSLDVENSDSDSDALNELCKSLSRSIKMLIDYGFNKAKKVLEDLDIIADSLSELGFDYYAEQIWDIVAPLRQDSFNESKKRKVIGKVSMKEAKKALKEDVDYDLLLNAFTTNLDSAGVEYQMDDDKVYYVNNSDKVKEIAQQVCHEFNDYAKPVFSDPNSKKFYQWVTFTDNDEPTKAGEGSGELTAYQKSIIEDMAENDYEVGHPMSEDDALEWFSSGEEEDIPTDLAQEAANYYFEAFDQAREDDNSDFEDEE